MASNREQPIIQLSDIRKRYRLGQFNAETFQEEFKQWMSRVRSGDTDSSETHPETPHGSILALDGVDLSVYPGERLGIIGRNGAGKSTLLKLICRITPPSSGKITLRGRVASMLEVGTGFQGDMTGRENIYLSAAIHGMNRAEIESKIEDIIDFSEVREFIDTPIKRYSSGMYVKLGFAVAAFIDCEIMIMDEVLAVGDLEFQRKCLTKMRDISREENRTILYVSHNMKTIRHLCNRCIVMDKGRIIFDGDTEEAIRVYTQLNGLSDGGVRFGGESRPFDEYLRSNIRLNMESLNIIGGDTEFRTGTCGDLCLECTAMIPLRRVGFRFEFWAENGTKIGTMLSGNFVDLDPGHNTIFIKIDFSHLSCGEYRADLVAYLFDDEGNEDILDGVYPGLVFTVTTPADRENYLDWHHVYWGNVRLHDLIIRKATDQG